MLLINHTIQNSQQVYSMDAQDTKCVGNYTRVYSV
jgi:hypothetical protein